MKDVFQQLKPYLEDYVESITEKSSNNKHNYVCPLCNSGDGKHGTGGFSIDNTGEFWKCFSCDNSGDIVDLYCYVTGGSDKRKAVQALQEMYLTGDKAPKARQRKDRTIEIDVRDYINAAAQKIEDTDYWEKRGLSLATVKAYKLGYDAHWKYPKGEYRGQGTSVLIIPTSDNSYLARATEGKNKYKVNNAQLYNFHALLEESNKPVFIVEGEIDSLSIIEVGYDAVALGSTSNVQAFIDRINSTGIKRSIIVCMDNDDAGNAAAKKLDQALSLLGISYTVATLSNEHKDANDYLVKNKERFIARIETLVQEQEGKEEINKDTYMTNSMSEYMHDYMQHLINTKDEIAIATGFNKLDDYLDGGLYEGLYVLGAESGVGKTSLTLQMMDNIAKAGNDVLIFSLEMGKHELVAKSIGRCMLQLVKKKKNEYTHDMICSPRALMHGQGFFSLLGKKRELANEGIEEYKKYCSRVFIFEGYNSIGVEFIRDTVNKHIEYTGRKPVVLIDYLQILKGDLENGSDKQNTDYNVSNIKRLSRDFHIPVIVISSLNRASYKDKISMASFKESGGIEYGCDILLGLQYRNVGNNNFKVQEEQKKEPRELELVILKNRNGYVGGQIPIRFYPKFNYFE